MTVVTSETKVTSSARMPATLIGQDHRHANRSVYFVEGGGAISAMRGSCRMWENSSSL